MHMHMTRLLTFLVMDRGQLDQEGLGTYIAGEIINNVRFGP